MKIQIYSDLHNEFSLFNPPPSGADLVVLAGDIDTKTRGVKWANEVFTCPVIYVSGNHEFYGGHIDHTLRKMREAAASHVHVLDNEALIWKQTRFLCTTSWTGYSSTGNAVAATRLCWDRMNDFRAIRAGTNFRRLRPDDLVSRNKIAHKWLSQELAKQFDGKTVVVTHHAPLMSCLDVDEQGTHLDAAYANDWSPLFDNEIDLWIFGHTHHAVDLKFKGARVISNPKGYPREETGFTESLLLEI
ncbi:MULTISPECIES: metallophosphoesterase [Pseudomonas]|nr:MULTISPECIES: metallophosphoesterase [Pseudomonas]